MSDNPPIILTNAKFQVTTRRVCDSFSSVVSLLALDVWEPYQCGKSWTGRTKDSAATDIHGLLEREVHVTSWTHSLSDVLISLIEFMPTGT
jgi:hypothetical protein